ncbi:hypothetical protein ACIP5N_27660 [Streptomyces sp. NPDC088768]|uniref:hypothetical protein n=1 Tax=Streptomyces sp. NPDC088768 TaxID=3365894 RepID=UPI0037F9EF64
MAFYLVTDTATNAYGDADTFVVRASGTRQARGLAPVRSDAVVTRLLDGRDVPNGVILAQFAEPSPEAAEVEEDDDQAPADVEDQAPAAPAYSYI